MDVSIIGAGTIGLSLAWRLARSGVAVTVYDPDPGGGASTVAAGMLAPVTESMFGEEPLSRLALDSRMMWPDFAAELGVTDAYRRTGTLFVGLDAGDAGELDRQLSLYGDFGLHAERVDVAKAREWEPLLTHRVSGALLTTDDHQVDARRVHAALWQRTREAGVEFVAERVTDVAAVGGDIVVVANGCASAALAGLPVRPVRGQVLRLRGPAELRHTVRGRVKGHSVYVVPRDSGEVVIGATVDERGFDTTATVGDTYELLRRALEILPELAEYELAEINVGLRPGTPDNAPLLGRLGDSRVIAATGHYRQGVLLAPVTAALLTELITTGDVPAGLVPFDPLRFDAATNP